MKIYRDGFGKEYVHTGAFTVEDQIPPHGLPFYDDEADEVKFAIGGLKWADSKTPILRPATPEEAAAGEGKKMCPAGCGKSTRGTSPLKLEVGKAYRTRGGMMALVKVERRERGETSLWRFGGKVGNDEVDWRVDGREYGDREEDDDLVSEWPDEQEKQARAAEPRPEGAAQLTACTAKKDASASPVAPPAILPDWTDGDVEAYFGKHQLPFPASDLARRRAIVAHMNRKPEPKPDTRPDIPERDGPSDAIVARKHWRMFDR